MILKLYMDNKRKLGYQCLKLFPDITPTGGMGNVGYRKNQSRTAYSPATQNKDEFQNVESLEEVYVGFHI